MGVKACARNSCPNVMCDRYSDEYGYICDDCFEELVLKGIHISIEKFLDTEPNHTFGHATYKYFDAIFKMEES